MNLVEDAFRPPRTKMWGLFLRLRLLVQSGEEGGGFRGAELAALPGQYMTLTFNADLHDPRSPNAETPFATRFWSNAGVFLIRHCNSVDGSSRARRGVLFKELRFLMRSRQINRDKRPSLFGNIVL